MYLFVVSLIDGESQVDDTLLRKNIITALKAAVKKEKFYEFGMSDKEVKAEVNCSIAAFESLFDGVGTGNNKPHSTVVKYAYYNLLHFLSHDYVLI